ncbi:MAG: hypothetical protein J6N78_06140 [Clostridia bacterium]|nr:hypothetical protein [Clostridia bacterium]
MFVEHEFFIGLRDIDFQKNLKIKSMFSFLEDIGGIHSNIAGFGLLDIPVKHKSWVLLNWKLKFIRRPHYAETLKIKTWSRKIDKIYAYRDFEVYDENGQKVAIASSKWTLVDTQKLSICRIDEELLKSYTTENVQVFEEEITKLTEPKSYMQTCETQVTRDMIDINGHVHNLNYIDFAIQVVPFEIMRNAKEVEVMYKKEIRDNSKIKCFYTIEDGFHYAVLKSEDEQTLHAIIKIKI